MYLWDLLTCWGSWQQEYHATWNPYTSPEWLSRIWLLDLYNIRSTESSWNALTIGVLAVVLGCHTAESARLGTIGDCSSDICLIDRSISCRLKCKYSCFHFCLATLKNTAHSKWISEKFGRGSFKRVKKEGWPHRRPSSTEWFCSWHLLPWLREDKWYLPGRSVLLPPHHSM